MKPKLIIFDMDGTLYDINDVVAANYDMQVQFLMSQWGKTQQWVQDYLSANNIYPTMYDKSKSATELFLREGIDIKVWTQYREEHFNVNAIDKSKAVTQDILEQFADIAPLVLLSSNSYQSIIKVLTHLSISQSIFSIIICSDNFYGQSFTKKVAIMQISSQMSISYEDMFSIGDRYQTDVKPLEELGGKGVCISQPQDVDMVLKQLHC